MDAVAFRLPYNAPMIVSQRLRGQGGRVMRLAGFRGLALAALLGGFAACDDGATGTDVSGSASGKNEAAGQSCQMVDTAFQCTKNSRSCYGAGQGSSCPGGVLCAGDGNGMTCAYSCSQDSDCVERGSASVCMQGCQAMILNGYCVQPELQATFVEDVCPTSSMGTTGVAGVSNL
jgi:hypothetical protein